MVTLVIIQADDSSWLSRSMMLAPATIPDYHDHTLIRAGVLECICAADGWFNTKDSRADCGWGLVRISTASLMMEDEDNSVQTSLERI